MVPGASSPNGMSAVNAILAALQRGPDAIRLPASPFILPATPPGASPPDASGPASFSRMMMGQLLAAMDRTAMPPVSVLTSVTPHLEGIPTGLAAPPPMTGPVVGPPPGRGSPGTAIDAVPLADGGNTPGQHETDQNGTSSGSVRPLAALPASNLTRLSAAAHALIRVASADPTAVEPLRGAMLRSLDGLGHTAPLTNPLMVDGDAGSVDANPLRPLRRAIEVAPAAELVALAQMIVQSAPAPVQSPEAPRPLAPAPLPQPGQRFQDVLAAVSARAEIGTPAAELPLPPSAVPAATRAVPVSAAASAGVDQQPGGPAAARAVVPPVAAPRSEIESSVLPTTGRSIALAVPLAPETAIARTAVETYDATSRYAPRPPAAVAAAPGRMALPNLLTDAPMPMEAVLRSGIPVIASPQAPSPAAGAPRPDAPTSLPPALASAMSSVAPAAIATTRIPAALNAMTPVSVPMTAISSPVQATTMVADAVPAVASGLPNAMPPAVASQGTAAPMAMPAPVSVSDAPSSPVAASHPGMQDARTMPVASAQGMVPAGTAVAPAPHFTVSSPVVADAGVLVATPVVAGESPAAPTPGGLPLATGTVSPSGAPSAQHADSPRIAATALTPAPSDSTGAGSLSASTVPTGIANPLIRSQQVATTEPAAPMPEAPAAPRVAGPAARPDAESRDLAGGPREDAGALFARIHAAASGRVTGEPGGDPASRPTYPAMAEALDRIAAELSRTPAGAPRALEMNIEAPDLGRVRIRVAMTDAGTVAIELVAPNERAAAALRSDLPQLTASLEGRGQAVTGAQVSVAAAGFMTGQDGSGQSRQQPRWFEARSGGRRNGDADGEMPVTGATAAYARRWSSVDLVA